MRLRDNLLDEYKGSNCANNLFKGILAKASLGSKYQNDL